MYRIYIVEDEPGIAESIAAVAKTWDFEVLCASDFRAVLKEFASFSPHLVLMDISLPFFNGYHWCAELRKHSTVPIVFLSSASENMNIVMAMNMGADDFVAKPVDLTVLMAKIQALLRRSYDFATTRPILEHRGALLHTGEGFLEHHGNKLELSKNEFRILLTLMQSKGKVVSREKLMQALWQSDSFVDENALTVNVNRLRKRLAGAGLAGFIATKFGQGYLIEGG